MLKNKVNHCAGKAPKKIEKLSKLKMVNNTKMC